MTTWQKKALALATLAGAVQLTVTLFALNWLTDRFKDSSGNESLLWSFAIIVFSILLVRAMIVRYKVFSITSVVELIFIEACHKSVAAAKGSPAARFVPVMRYGSIDVSSERCKRLRRNWFFSVPDSFEFMQRNFRWHWNPYTMIKEARTVFPVKCPGSYNLDHLDFQISPTARTSDIYALGYGVAKIVLEDKLNEGTTYDVWRFQIHPAYGVSIRQKNSQHDGDDDGV